MKIQLARACARAFFITIILNRFMSNTTKPSAPFPCTQCGLCCQNVHLVAEIHFLDRGDGTCRHYDAPSKGCGIYADRPDICRVDRQYRLHYARQYSWDDFVLVNLAVCNSLQTREREEGTSKLILSCEFSFD